MRALWMGAAALLIASCGNAPAPEVAEGETDLAPVAQVEQSLDHLLSVLEGEASEEERLAALDKALAEVRSAAENQEQINTALRFANAPPEDRSAESEEQDVSREDLQQAFDELDAMLPEMDLLDLSGFDAKQAEPAQDAFPSLAERAGSKMSEMRQSDWPTTVLSDGLQDRLIVRRAAIRALEDRNTLQTQRRLAQMDQSQDPYRHYIRAFASAEGIGMPKNEAAVLGYAEAAAEGGVAEASLLIMGLYLQGIGVEADPQKAKLWNLRAMEAALPDAYKAFGNLMLDGTYGEIKPALMLHVLEHSENRFRSEMKGKRAELLITGAAGRTDLEEAYSIATSLAETTWDDELKAQGEAFLARPEFAEAGMSAKP